MEFGAGLCLILQRGWWWCCCCYYHAVPWSASTCCRCICCVAGVCLKLCPQHSAARAGSHFFVRSVFLLLSFVINRHARTGDCAQFCSCGTAEYRLVRAWIHDLGVTRWPISVIVFSGYPAAFMFKAGGGCYWPAWLPGCPAAVDHQA